MQVLFVCRSEWGSEIDPLWLCLACDVTCFLKVDPSHVHGYPGHFATSGLSDRLQGIGMAISGLMFK